MTGRGRGRRLARATATLSKKGITACPAPPSTSRAPPPPSWPRHAPYYWAASWRARPPRPPLPDRSRPEMQQRLEQVVAAGAPGVVALVNDGGRSDNRGRIWTGASGVADLRSGRPMRPDNHFRAGSVTKPFVATVVAAAGRRGQAVAVGHRRALASRDPALRRSGHRAPAAQPHRRRARIRLGRGERLYQGIRFRSWTPRELVALVADQPQAFPAGSTWSYSNTGYVLAGLIVEAATGQASATRSRGGSSGRCGCATPPSR